MNAFSKYLQEAGSSFNFVQPNNQQGNSPNIYNKNVGGNQEGKTVDPNDKSQYNNNSSDDEYSIPDDAEQTDTQDGNKPDSQDKEGGDPNKEGLIRRIKGAHLIYKRKSGDSTYEELWMYNIEKGMRDELDVRHAILAGTDVNPKTGLSQSGSQKYELWTNNNVQMLQVIGLPN